jgi:hypothetical protein
MEKDADGGDCLIAVGAMGAVVGSKGAVVGSMGAVEGSMGAVMGSKGAIVSSKGAVVGLMGAVVGSMGAVVGSKGPVVSSMLGAVGGSMVGNLTLEDDSKWLDGPILGAAGRLDGAESRAQERRWGRQR